MGASVDVLCPYCFETWPSSTAAFRCLRAAGDATCEDVADTAQGALLGVPPPLLKKVVTKRARFGRAFAAGKGGVMCECGARTTPVCPNCHSGLPHGYAESGDRLIGMVGTKSSGKSHFVAVLIHELYHGVGSRFGAVVELLDDDTRRRYDTDLFPRVYRDGLTLPATTSATGRDNRVRRPLGLRLKFGSDTVNTVFFDTAGEDLRAKSVLEREARYVGQCGALILLIDPLQIPAVRELVGSTATLPAEVAHPLEILTNVTELLRRERKVAAPTPLPQPLAIAFSKLDAIRGLFDEDELVLGEPHLGKAYDVVEARSIGAIIRAHLIRWLGPAFDDYAASNYAHTNYFAFSALGAQPLKNGRLARDVTPHRVADPLLWVLSEWKKIPVVTR